MYSNSVRRDIILQTPIVIIYFLKYLEPVKTNSTLMIFAIIAALGLVTVVAVDMILTAQEAEARGCTRSVAANASQGRCVRPDIQSADEQTVAEEEATVEEDIEDEEEEEEPTVENEEDTDEDDE
jgi:hypothetical protein